ncbi:hypothetical protein AQUCO_01800254v1 [Aquilegia coerulea]|nr:hypothetical protein AQUCO_01800254v1 [Aquilegia coerulea]
MMRSVMNKIFERECNSSTEISNVRVPTEEESPNQSTKDAPSSESVADQDSDADNLVINIVSGGNAELSQMEKGRLKNEPNPAKRLSSSAGSTENKFKAQKEKNNVLFNSSDPISKKMPCLLPSDESNRNEFTSTMPQKKENPETYIVESRDSIVAQPDKKSSSQQLATGHLRGQKSSWKKLVGETANSSFSISDILPDVITKQNAPKSSGVEATNIPGRKRKKLMKQSANIEPVESTKDELLQDNLSTGGPSINARKLNKRAKPADYEPVEPTMDKCLQDISTDGPSIITTNTIQEELMKQAGCKAANSEPLELEKVEIIQDKVGTDDPPINAQNSMKQGKSANSEPMRLTNEEILHDNVSAKGQSTVAPSGISSKESESPEDIRPADQLASDHQTVGGQSWIQKSSWRELVGEIGNSSFSISHVLPDITSRRQNLQIYNCTGIVNANDSEKTSTKQFTRELSGNESNDAGNCVIVDDKVILTGSNMASSSKKKVSSGGLETDKVKRISENHKIDGSECSKSSGSTNNAASNRKAPMDVKIGEVCTFMRSDESKREWIKTRATLSAALKKKSNEKL